ncbi:hypothetical protein [Staphylococcus aureus]|uniref:hypothetical protein n=1 Tax=Staphylococcus aureus TaxID=1280 RepID=UPI000F3C1EC5|nr:hypothetical protein [Staphylococcus aureus]RNG65120.1 hypothetical protein D1G04_13745 [Staphylococcus aureus]
MFEINNDFKNLDVDSYKVNNKATVYLIPVVAPIIREGKSKDSTIKTFKKNIETAGIVRSFDIGVNNENEKEPFREFSDIEYVVTDLNSLKHIKENKRFNMNFGLRYFIPEIDENRLFLINNDILDKISETDVTDANQKIDFNQLQILNDEIIDQLHLIHEYQSFEKLQEVMGIDLPKENHENENTEEDVAEDEEALTESEEIENETSEVENVEEYDNEVNENLEESNISLLKQELYNKIDTAVPSVYIDESETEFNSIIKNQDYDKSVKPTYEKLEKLTQEEFEEVKRYRLKASQEKRKRIVQAIYNELVSEIWSRSIEADKQLNYKSSESRYHIPYQEIESKFEETKSIIPQKVEEYEERLTEEFEKDKAYRAEQAKKAEEDRIENEERPILHNRVREFEQNLHNENKEVYNEQIEVLNGDVANTWESTYARIVDDVLKANKNYIDKESDKVNQLMQKDFEEIIDKRDKSIESLRAKIRDIETKRIEDQKNFEERVTAEVKEQTNDYELRDNQMNEEIRALRTDLQKLKNDNTDKEELIRSLQQRRDSDQEEIKRLNESLNQAHERNFNFSEKAMTIQERALSMQGDKNFNGVVASNGVGNLPEELVEKANRIEKRRKSGLFTWLGSLFLTVVIGTGLGFNAHAAETQKIEQNKVQSEQKAQMETIKEQKKSLEDAKKDKEEAEKKAKEAKEEKDKKEKDKKDDKSKKDKK